MRQDTYYLNLVNSYFKQGKTVGFIDEVGRGACAGDLYACCVVMENNKFFDCTIDDSKKVNKLDMCILANLIKQNVLAYALGIVTVQEIYDMRNINKSTFLAMQRAVLALAKPPDVLYIDGPWTIDVPIKQYPVIHGDSKIYGIACASIIAKDARDAYMKLLHTEHPYYSWNTNAGYGSKKHFDGIKRHGLTKYHRLNFRGVR